MLIGIHALPGLTRGTTPTLGRNPTTLPHAAGLRSEPPVSLPSAVATMRQASATAAPPLDPPALHPRLHGFRVTPYTSLNVCEPAPNSGEFVLPTATAPAAFIRATSRQSAAGRCPANSGDPYVVVKSAVSTRSLWAVTSPANGPGSSPAAIASSTSAGPPPSDVRIEGDDRVDERIDRVDPRQVSVEQLAGRNLPRLDQTPLLDRGEVDELPHERHRTTPGPTGRRGG